MVAMFGVPQANVADGRYDPGGWADEPAQVRGNGAKRNCSLNRGKTNLHCEARICVIVCSDEMPHTEKPLHMSVSMLDTIGQTGCFRYGKDRENSTSEKPRFEPH